MNSNWSIGDSKSKNIRKWGGGVDHVNSAGERGVDFGWSVISDAALPAQPSQPSHLGEDDTAAVPRTRLGGSVPRSLPRFLARRSNFEIPSWTISNHHPPSACASVKRFRTPSSALNDPSVVRFFPPLFVVCLCFPTWLFSPSTSLVIEFFGATWGHRSLWRRPGI